MAVFPNSAPAPRFHPFVITGKAGDFPRTQAERLALYAAGALRSNPSRRVVEDLIEALIGYLDALDGCPDLEDGGDAEPCIGSREIWTGDQSAWAHGQHDERERDPADLEPSLGSLERGPEQSQVGWAFSGDDDREYEPVRRPRNLPRRDAPIPVISMAECVVVEVRQ